MQILRTYGAICVAACSLAALSTKASDTSTQAPPPTATSPQTITNKAELKKETKAEAKARKEAAKKAKREAEAKARQESEAKAKAEKSKAAKPEVEKKPPAIKPLESPPLPISADKEQRLEELLQKYKADQITPEQYQEARAKILAGP